VLQYNTTITMNHSSSYAYRNDNEPQGASHSRGQASSSSGMSYTGGAGVTN